MNTTTATHLAPRFAAIAILGLLPASMMGQPGPPNNISVPPAIAVPAGNKAFLTAAAAGTQNYLCLPTGWTFIGPQATLFLATPWMNGQIRHQVATHYLSRNPGESGTPRPTWEHSGDSSRVWARPIASSTDPGYVDPTAVPWLLLQAAGTEDGTTGNSVFSQTTYIQRVNTAGGLIPVTPCMVGERAFVPYTADYVFYRKHK